MHGPVAQPGLEHYADMMQSRFGDEKLRAYLDCNILFRNVGVLRSNRSRPIFKKRK